jgi:hypothetical protein
MGEEMSTKDTETTLRPKKKWTPHGPPSEEDIQRVAQQRKKEREESTERLKLQQEREKRWYQLQAELMQKDQSGINFFESQVESLKLLLIYLKEIDYRLPLHMDLKPYSIILNELIETLSKIRFAKYMDEESVKKKAVELGSIKSHIDEAIEKVKARKKYMVYL